MNWIEVGVKALLILSNAFLLFVFGWSALHFPRIEIHLALGVASTLLVLFTQTSVLFYFIGSGIWIRDQAKQLYADDKERAQRIWGYYMAANKLKGPVMPFATFALGLGLFTIILGGATQVGALPHWVHPTLAFLLLVNNGIGHRTAWRGIKKNLEYLDLTSKEVG